MISGYDLYQAMVKFPLPKLCMWYLNHFPKKLFNAIEIGLFGIGFSMGVLDGKTGKQSLVKKTQGIATLLFCMVLIPAGAIHTISWFQKRATFKRRASYLHITLQEYNSYL